MDPFTPIAERNRQLFDDRQVIPLYTGESLQIPETVILLHHASRIQQGAVLDLGCGAGRTSHYLLPLAGSYLGVDYAPGMIDACRKRFPQQAQRFMVGDARRLEGLPDAGFDFILFSFNGLDYLPPEERSSALQTIRRKLKPDGLFVFSSHNRHGPSARVTPPALSWSLHPLRMYWNFRRWQLRRRNHRQLAGLQKFQDDCALVNDAAHDYGLLTCYIASDQQCQQLRACGLEAITLYDQAGQPHTRPAPFATSKWIHYLCRRLD